MNVGDLFDSPLKIAIVAVVIIVLFGSKKLPGAARSLGQSMRILKKEVQGLHEDETAPGAHAPAQASAPAGPATVVPPAQLTSPPVAPVPAADQQVQIDALQQQIRDLQRASAMDTVPADAPRSQQPS
jgi:sec-independent protein translocase protein TatA